MEKALTNRCAVVSRFFELPLQQYDVLKIFYLKYKQRRNRTATGHTGCTEKSAKVVIVRQ
jgi:hypothetical protein